MVPSHSISSPRIDNCGDSKATISMLSVTSQSKLSVTVTKYVPAASMINSDVGSLVDHKISSKSPATVIVVDKSGQKPARPMMESIGFSA